MPAIPVHVQVLIPNTYCYPYSQYTPGSKITPVPLCTPRKSRLLFYTPRAYARAFTVQRTQQTAHSACGVYHVVNISGTAESGYNCIETNTMSQARWPFTLQNAPSELVVSQQLRKLRTLPKQPKLAKKSGKHLWERANHKRVEVKAGLRSALYLSCTECK